MKIELLLPFKLSKCLKRVVINKISVVNILMFIFNVLYVLANFRGHVPKVSNIPFTNIMPKTYFSYTEAFKRLCLWQNSAYEIILSRSYYLTNYCVIQIYIFACSSLWFKRKRKVHDKYNNIDVLDGGEVKFLSNVID